MPMHRHKPKPVLTQIESNNPRFSPTDEVDCILRQQLPYTLDLRPYSARITDQMLVEIAIVLMQRKTPIERLCISGCDQFSAVGMRSLVHAIGPHILALDYSASIVKKQVLKVLVTRLEDLRELDFSSCPTLAGDILRDFIPCCNRTLEKCNLSNSKLINDEAMGWLAGTLGVNGGMTQCLNLVSLNLAHNELVGNRGLSALGSGCPALQFLNLEGLVNITDQGMENLVQGCRLLRVFHLKRCVQLSDRALVAIGSRCHKLRSINLCGCGRITTEGMKALVRGSPLLQAVDVQGCNLLTEEMLCVVASGLRALQLLNVNGCQQITDNGILTLSEHLPYVTQATKFRGLEPRSNAKDLKYATHVKTIEHSAAIRIQSWFRGHLGRAQASCWRRNRLELPAVKRLKHWYMMVRLVREINRRAASTRLIQTSAIPIQALARGFLVRARIYRAADDAFRLHVGNIAATKIQKRYRGHFIRHGTTMVNQALHRMRVRFAEQRRIRFIIRVQRCYRARLSRCRLFEAMQVNAMRRRQCHEAAMKLQRLYRSRAARAQTATLRRAMEEHRAWLRHRDRVALQMQANWRRHAARRTIDAARAEYKARLAIQQHAATQIQRIGRGWHGRQRAHQRRAEYMKQTEAAMRIERWWIRCNAPPGRAIEYQSIVAQIKLQLIQEETEAVAKAEAMLQKERRKHAMDSASEADSEDDWYEYIGSDGRPSWFSPSRETRYIVRPNCFAMEKSLVGMRLKMYWPYEEKWFEGSIVKYCTSKRKHKIEYDDGDKEWSVLEEMEHSHIQLYNGNCWMMYDNYAPSALALKAALFVNVRMQRYVIELFTWAQGKIHSYNESNGCFLIHYDDGTSEEFDIFGHGDDVQVQDRRSLQWMGLGTYFFGGMFEIPPHVQDYLVYDGPYEESQVNYSSLEETAVENGGELPVMYGDWTQESYMNDNINQETQVEEYTWAISSEVDVEGNAITSERGAETDDEQGSEEEDEERENTDEEGSADEEDGENDGETDGDGT